MRLKEGVHNMFKYFLLKLEVSGIKNISKPISINLISTSQKKNKITIDNSNVKAIYGENGAGKSALMNAVDIYKQICTRFAYFASDIDKRKIIELINKSKKSFFVRTYFAACDESNKIINLYSHEIRIDLKDEIPVLAEEKLIKYLGYSLNSEHETLLYLKQGQIKSKTNEELKYMDILSDCLNSATGMSSAFSFVTNPTLFGKLYFEFEKGAKKNKNSKIPDLMEAFIHLISFTGNLNIYLDESDKHDYIPAEIINKFVHNSDDGIGSDSISISDANETIRKTELKQYEEKISQLTKFIQIFKPELKCISLSKKNDGSNYVISKDFCYEGYSVNSEYESNGIKRLVKMFDYLNKAANGKIVFIDEMDANINTVYLEKLIEFYAKYGEGQLIFTSHNIAPMAALRKVKNGIDFINTNTEIISWINNGNYRPDSQYMKGMIPKLPFNVDDFDFLACFK